MVYARTPVMAKEEPDECVLLIEELDSSPMSTAQFSHCTDRDHMLVHVREYMLWGWPVERSTRTWQEMSYVCKAVVSCGVPEW